MGFDGVTKRSMRGVLLDLRSWHKERLQENPQARFKAWLQVQRKSLAAMLAKFRKARFREKLLKLSIGNRTVNRHRWVGGEHQGERVSPR